MRRALGASAPGAMAILGLLFAYAPAHAAAAHLYKKEMVYRVDKVSELSQGLAKRDDAICPQDTKACPPSKNGQCCPNAYDCETDSCVLPSMSSGTACGQQGFKYCPFDIGGCCREGFECVLNGCLPPAGMSYQPQCPTNYYACPREMNYGCCKNGLACAQNGCYSTEPVTATLTTTRVTTSNGVAATITQVTVTVTTPTAPATLRPADLGAGEAKVVPSSVPKVTAIQQPPQATGGGLPKEQIGGIVGGLIALLIIIIIAAVYIVRKLNHTKRVVELSKISTSSGGTAAKNSKGMVQFQPTASQVHYMEYDDLLATKSLPTTRTRAVSDFSSSTNPTPFAVGDASTSVDGASVVGSYFDIPPHDNANDPVAGATDPARRHRAGSRDTAPQGYAHVRNQSVTSELSDTSSVTAHGLGSPLIPAELDTTGSLVPELAAASPLSYSHHPFPLSHAEQVAQLRVQRSTSIAQTPIVVTGLGINGAPPMARFRDRSTATTRARERQNSADSVGVDTLGTDTLGSLVSPQAPAARGRDRSGSVPQTTHLDVVAETVEHMHGHYGPVNVNVGQTRAQADIQHDISSPVAPGFTGATAPFNP